MEDKLVTSICVFLPPSQLVVQCEGHAFSKFSVMISCETNEAATHLEAQTKVKILRHTSIWPPFGLAVRFIKECHTLESFPSDECIVAYEGRNVTTTNTVFDWAIHDVGEVCDYPHVSKKNSIESNTNTHCRFRIRCARLAWRQSHAGELLLLDFHTFPRHRRVGSPPEHGYHNRY